MGEYFAAQSLVQTKTSEDRRRFELTFVDAEGKEQVVSVPIGIASDLVPVLEALAGTGSDNGAKFTRMPRQCAVGTARHERLVLIKFDDDPPYGLDVNVAKTLWREVRKEAESVARQKAPALQ
jgi:hypothetical protein